MTRRHEILIEGTSVGAGLRGMGQYFVDQLKEDGERPDVPAEVKREWFTLAAWLGHAGGELTKEQKQKVAGAWTAYLVIGVAPSKSLQQNFDFFAAEVAGQESSKPPKEIMDVFDRMLASDHEIRIKRESDLRVERKNLKQVFEGVRVTPARGISTDDREWRKVAFVTAAWTAAVFLYAWLFDPFDQGGWDNLEDEDLNRLIVISLLPLSALLMFKAYRKWVR